MKYKNSVLIPVLFVICFLLISLLFFSPKESPHASKKYNIILVTFDALGARYLDLYGFNIRTAPHISNYANECYIFSDAVSQSGSTSFSLGSLFSSRYPFTDNLIIEKKDNAFRKNKLYLPYILQKAGYKTYGIVRDHYSRGKYGFNLGFDYFDDDFIAGDAEETFASSINLLKRVKEPFFLWIHNEEPHAPYLPPEKYLKMIYKKENVPTVYSFLDPSIEKTIEIFKKDEYQKYHQDLLQMSSHIQRCEIYGREMDVGELELDELKARYLANIRYADEHFGKFIRYLKSTGAYANTMVIISADHGESLGPHGIFDHNDLYQNIIHVPLLIHMPGQDFKKLVDTPVELVDIHPTITEFLGVKVEYDIRGENLFASQRKKRFQFSEYPGKRVFIRDSLKYWCFINECYYYNLTEDPDELHNKSLTKRHQKNVCNLPKLRQNIFLKGKTAEPINQTQRKERATPSHLKRMQNIFPELKRFTVMEIINHNEKEIHRLKDGEEILKIEVSKQVPETKAGKIIEGEIFQIKALYSTNFSPYPERITKRIECPQKLQPVLFKKNIDGKMLRYLLTYSNERLGIGVFSEDLISYRVLIGWTYMPDSRELFKVRYYLPLPAEDKRLHQFFNTLITKK